MRSKELSSTQATPAPPTHTHMPQPSSSHVQQRMPSTLSKQKQFGPGCRGGTYNTLNVKVSETDAQCDQMNQVPGGDTAGNRGQADVHLTNDRQQCYLCFISVLSEQQVLLLCWKHTRPPLQYTASSKAMLYAQRHTDFLPHLQCTAPTRSPEPATGECSEAPCTSHHGCHPDGC